MIAEETYRLWYWLLFAALVQRAAHPRPRIPMIVIDGQDRGPSPAEAIELIASEMLSHFR